MEIDEGQLGARHRDREGLRMALVHVVEVSQTGLATHSRRAAVARRDYEHYTGWALRRMDYIHHYNAGVEPRRPSLLDQPN